SPGSDLSLIHLPAAPPACQPTPEQAQQAATPAPPAGQTTTTTTTTKGIYTWPDHTPLRRRHHQRQDAISQRSRIASLRTEVGTKPSRSLMASMDALVTSFSVDTWVTSGRSADSRRRQPSLIHRARPCPRCPART